MKFYGWITLNGEKQKVHVKEYHPDQGCVTDDLGRALVPKEDCFLVWPGEYHAKRPSPWREIWQSYSPSKYLELDFEVDNKTYTADLVDRMGYIVEFQHSGITLEEVQKKEQLYQKMYWMVDASQADWIHLDSLLDDTVIRAISTEYILVKERKVWWSYFNRAMFLDLGVGIGCIEKLYYSSSLTRYYLCRLCSYEYFLRSLFHLKSNFELNPIHQVSIDSKIHRAHELEYTVRLDGESIWVDCSSHWTHQYREILEQFGMRRSSESKKFTFRLFYSKERAQHEEAITECRELLQSIRESLETEYKERLEELQGISEKLDLLSSL